MIWLRVAADAAHQVGLVLCRAGKRPKTNPVTTESAPAKRSIVPLSSGCRSCEVLGSMRVNATRVHFRHQDAREAAHRPEQYRLGEELGQQVLAPRA